MIPMTAQKHEFHVGDRAIYRFGQSDVPVEVIEEVGPVGRDRALHVRVLMFLTDTDPMDITVPEADLRRTDTAA